MSRKVPLLFVVLGMAVVAMAGMRQFSVPDIEARQRSLFRGFEELQSLKAYVVTSDGKMLGRISKGYDSDSLSNDYGAGNPMRTDGLFNKYGRYGSSTSSTSAFCDNASSPPEILVKRDGDTYSVGLLTVNRYARTRGQRVNPYLLQAWLESK